LPGFPSVSVLYTGVQRQWKSVLDPADENLHPWQEGLLPDFAAPEGLASSASTRHHR
jgi:hypothetical protein